MAHREIEDVIIGVLADMQHLPAEELRRQLEAAGDELPVDSVRAVEVLVKVQNYFGIRMPLTAETAECLRSVSAFAAKVHALMDEAAAVAQAEGA